MPSIDSIITRLFSGRPVSAVARQSSSSTRTKPGTSGVIARTTTPVFPINLSILVFLVVTIKRFNQAPPEKEVKPDQNDSANQTHNQTGHRPQ